MILFKSPKTFKCSSLKFIIFINLLINRQLVIDLKLVFKFPFKLTFSTDKSAGQLLKLLRYKFGAKFVVCLIFVEKSHIKNIFAMEILSKLSLYTQSVGAINGVFCNTL